MREKVGCSDDGPGEVDPCRFIPMARVGRTRQVNTKPKPSKVDDLLIIMIRNAKMMHFSPE